MPSGPDDKRFIGWILGINAVLVCAGIGVVGSSMMTLSNSVSTLSANYTNLNANLASVQVQVMEGMRSRYTSEQASIDKGEMLKLMGQFADRWSNQINAKESRDNSQDARISDLIEFKARIEERLRETGNK